MLFVVLLSHGVRQEWNLFNQQLPLTVPQLGTSCRFNSQVVPQRDTSLIEIQKSVSRSSSQSGTAAEKNMKWNQPDCVLSLSLILLDCALVVKLFEEPLLLSEQINLERSLSDDCYKASCACIVLACPHQLTQHRHSGDSLFNPHQLWLPLMRYVEMSHFTYHNISPHIKLCILPWNKGNVKGRGCEKDVPFTHTTETPTEVASLWIRTRG